MFCAHAQGPASELSLEEVSMVLINDSLRRHVQILKGTVSECLYWSLSRTAQMLSSRPNWELPSFKQHSLSMHCKNLRNSHPHPTAAHSFRGRNTNTALFSLSNGTFLQFSSLGHCKNTKRGAMNLVSAPFQQASTYCDLPPRLSRQGSERSPGQTSCSVISALKSV
jgi:hypothetical protein